MSESSPIRLARARKVWSTPRRPMRLGLTLSVIALIAGPLLACQVPVFRYALERWSADRYQVFVLHDGPLDTARHAAALELLKKAAAKDSVHPAAIDLHLVDVRNPDQAPHPGLLPWWQKQQTTEPLLAVYYPPANRLSANMPFYHAQLETANIQKILDSPVRQELLKRLQEGDSAVWIFVPSGREAEDRQALETLQQQLLADADWLKLPTPDELEIEPEVLRKTKIPLKIQFSILTLDREDVAEDLLLQSLLHSEEDLRDFDQPLAFPVFGQGRVLYCLVGKGIAEDTIREASAFMAGPCSCQVKNQNPGFDLLLTANWKKALGDVLISEPIESLDEEALEPVLLTIPPGRK